MSRQTRKPRRVWSRFLCLALIASASPARADKAFGEYLASECAACHQLSGKAVGAIPPIVAIPEDQFIALMLAYKNRQRDNQVMQTIAGRLKDDELKALAQFFGGLPAPKN
jgi:cytochrome c553